MQVILFGFAVLINRYSGLDEIVLGIPFMGRIHKRWYQTIGLFVNTCLHAIRLSSQVNVMTHIQQIKQHLLADLTHATIPFDEIVKALYARQQLTPKHNFNVLYNFIQFDDTDYSIGNTINGAPTYCALPISKFDLSLHVHASNSKVDLFFEYRLICMSKKRYRAWLRIYFLC